MNSKILGLLAVALLAGPMAADAALLRLDATPTFAGYSGFYVLFDDTGDGMLSLGEITYFSGANFDDGSLFADFDAIQSVADIAGVAVNSNSCTNANYNGWWCFHDFSPPPNGWAVEPFVWTYRINAVNAVPEPGTLALLGLGLTGLALSRKCKAA